MANLTSPRPALSEIRPSIAVSDFSDETSNASTEETDELWRGVEAELLKRLKISHRKVDEGPVNISDKMLARCREYFLRAQSETKLWKVVVDASAAQRALLAHRKKLMQDAPGSRLPPLRLQGDASTLHPKELKVGRHADEVALCALAKVFKELADRIEVAHPNYTHEFLSYTSPKDRGPEADEMLFRSVQSVDSINWRNRDTLGPDIEIFQSFLAAFDKRQRHLMRDFLEKASRLLKFLGDLKEHRPCTQGEKEFGGYLHYGPVGDLPLHLVYLHGVSVLCWSTVHDIYVRNNHISLPYRSDLRWALHRCGRRDLDALNARWVKEGWVGPHMRDATMGMFTGESVLHIAIAQQAEEVVEMLLESNIDVRAVANGVFFAPSRIVPYYGSLDYYHYFVHYNQIGKRWGRVIMPLISTQWSRRKSSLSKIDLPMRRYYYHELKEMASLMHTWVGGSALIHNEESGWYGGELPLSFAASVGNTTIMWHIVSHVKNEMYRRWKDGEGNATSTTPHRNSHCLTDLSSHSPPRLSPLGSLRASPRGRPSRSGHDRFPGDDESDDSQTPADKDNKNIASTSSIELPAPRIPIEQSLASPRGRVISLSSLRGKSFAVDTTLREDLAAGKVGDQDGGGVFEKQPRNEDGSAKQKSGEKDAGVSGIAVHGPARAGERAEQLRRDGTMRQSWIKNNQRSFMARPGRSEPEWVDVTSFHDLQKEAVSNFINAQDSHGNTALHMAVYHNQPEAVDWIMENGGQRSFTLLNHLGLTPFTLSAYLGNAEMFLQIINTHMSEQMWTYGPVCSTKTNLALIDSFRITALRESDKPDSRPNSYERASVQHKEVSWTDCISELHADRNYRSALEVVIEHRVEGIFANPQAIELVKQLVHKKWSKFGRRQHIFHRFVPYLLFAVVFSAMISMRANLLRSDHYADSHDLPRELTSTRVIVWTLELALLFLGVPFLLRSAWVNKRVRVTDLDVNMDGVVDFQERVIFLFKNISSVPPLLSASLSHLLSGVAPGATPSVSSALDLVSTALMLLCGLLRVGGWQQLEVQLLAVATIIVWSNVLSTFMPFEYVGSLVITIHEMLVGDVAKFMIIYLVLVIGFGQAFYLLLQGGDFSADKDLQSEVQCVDCDQHLGKMLLKLVWVSLGESDQMALIETMSAPNLAVGIHIVYVILSLLLLLNLIIAMMGDTFNRQNRQIEKHWFYPYAEMVLRYEKKLSRSEQLRCRVGIQAHRDDDELSNGEPASGLVSRKESRESTMSWMYQYQNNTSHQADHEIRL